MQHVADNRMPDIRKQLVRELLKIEGVTEIIWPDRSDGFTSLSYDGKDFAHFHNDNEIDIRLTRAIISSELPAPPGTSKNHPNRSPNSPWIEIRFFDKSDIDEIIRLTKQLLKK